MAQLKLFAVFLLALYGAERASAVPPVVVEGPDELIEAINMARRWKLSVTVGEVKKDERLTQAVVGMLPAAVGDDCESKWQLTVGLTRGVLIFHGPKIEKSDFYLLVQELLDRGLGAMREYPEVPWDTELRPWVNEPVANLSYLLWSTSSHVGCGYTTSCPRVQVLVCIFDPTVVEGTYPFSKEYYDALRSRDAPLRDPKSGDADAPHSGEAKNIPSASLLLVGLAAVLTMVAK